MPQTRVGHCRIDDQQQADGVYIGRKRRGQKLCHARNTPLGDPGWLGNPFPVDDQDDPNERRRSIRKFADWFADALDSDPALRASVARLQGRTLLCWCRSLAASEPPCHGDIIKTHAERLGPPTISEACPDGDHRLVEDYQGRRVCCECYLTVGSFSDWLGHAEWEVVDA